MASIKNSIDLNQIKDIKLNALLEMTKAINHNYSTSELLDIYQNTLESNLTVKNLVLYSFSNEWSCILKFGINNHLDFNPQTTLIKDIEIISSDKNGQEFKNIDVIIPVYHKKNPLAYVLLSFLNSNEIDIQNNINHLPFIQTLTNIVVVAIENKKLYKSSIQKAAIQKELELAQSMQKLLFPTKLPNIEELEMQALYLPHQQVGGDYYDVIWINEVEFVFCLADVSGKGISAALLMSNIQAALRVILKYSQNLSEIVTDLNQLICDNAKHEKFVSLFIAKYNIGTKQLSYINAGHNAPILLNNNFVTFLDKGCTLLGIINPLPNIETTSLLIPSSSIIFAYTDGFTETNNSSNDTITIEQITDILSNNKNSSANFINKAMLFYLEEFKGEMPFIDDIALLTCKFN